ncbi:hypothetical protein FRC10_009705 [Ceratobasidium sp. 414]|nr:hypothetical protein FRC10_009705 [Ceratobasidium sp. 414]
MLASTYVGTMYGTSEVVSRFGVQSSQGFECPATTLHSTQIPLAVLQAHLQAPHSTMRVLPSFVDPAVTCASAATTSAVSLTCARFAVKQGVENTNTHEGLGPLSTPIFGSEVHSVVEQARCVMGGSFFYGPAGMTHAPVEPAQNIAHHQLPPIPGRVLPRSATPFNIQGVPTAEDSERFTLTCASPRPGTAVLVPHAQVAPF